MNTQDCKTELTERMFPFWASLIDRENGGFFGEHDGTKVNQKALKGSIYHARILWFFATGEKVLQNKAFAEYADHAYEFICNKCIDKTSGGVYWALDYTGKPADTDKHAYAAAFTLYGLAAYYRARKSAAALAAAKAVFNCLETKFKTDIAFNEQYDQNWNLLPNRKLAHESGASKTMNTLLHIMEAYTEFCVALREVSGGNDFVDSNFIEHVAQCLESVYRIIMQKVLTADSRRMDLFFDDALSVVNHEGVVTKSFGHDIEASWLLTEAARALGCLDADKNRFIALADATLAEGFDGEALCNEGYIDADGKKRIDSDRIWWVHAETIVAMQNAFELTQGLTHTAQYLKISAAVWAYIKSTGTRTKSGQSEWLWGIKKDGGVFNATLASMWKCPYHNGRMFYELIKRGAEF